jgi:hypothetical protein
MNSYTTVKNAVFWNMTPRDSCKNRCFGGTYLFHHQGDKNQRARNSVNSNLQLKHAANQYYISIMQYSRVFLPSVLRLLVTANVVPSSASLVNLMMEMEPKRCSETSVLTTVTRPIPEVGSLHNHRRENIKSYIALIGWAL